VNRARLAAVALAAILAVALLALVGWPGREYRNGDFFQYYAGAVAVASGASPYDRRWTAEFAARQGSAALHVPPQPASGDPSWTTPYPLYLFIAILPIAFLPLDAAAAAWLVAQALCVVAGLAFVSRPLRSATRRGGWLIAGIALGFQPLWLLPGNGNITGFLFGAVAGAVGMTLRGRPMAAGAFLAICAVKPQSLVLVAIALLIVTPAGERRRLIGGAALVGLPLLVSAFAFQPGWMSAWIDAAAALQRTRFSNATGWTIDRIAAGIPLVASPVAVGVAAAALALWWWRLRPAPAWAIAAAIPISVFAAPHGWTYEQLYLLFSATVVIGAIGAMGCAHPARRFLLLGAVAVAFGPIPWGLYAWDLMRNGEEASAIVPLVVFAVVVLGQRVTASPPQRVPHAASATALH
jgi:hypothetical protein